MTSSTSFVEKSGNAECHFTGNSWVVTVLQDIPFVAAEGSVFEFDRLDPKAEAKKAQKDAEKAQKDAKRKIHVLSMTIAPPRCFTLLSLCVSLFRLEVTATPDQRPGTRSLRTACGFAGEERTAAYLRTRPPQAINCPQALRH